MESAGYSGPRQVIINGKTYYPSKNSHFKFTQKQADEMIAAGKIRVNPRSNKPEYWVEAKDFETLYGSCLNLSLVYIGGVADGSDQIGIEAMFLPAIASSLKQGFVVLVYAV